MIEFQQKVSDFLQIDNNTLATILCTLLVFVVGGLIRQFYNYMQSYWDRKRKRKLFENVATEYFKQIEKQASLLKKSSSAFSFSNDPGFQIYRADLHTNSILNSIGYDKVFEAYFFGFENMFESRVSLRIKAFNKIWTTIISAEVQHNQAYDSFARFIDKYNNYNAKRNDHLDAFRKAFEGHVLNAVGKKVGSELPAKVARYLKEAVQIHVQWQALENPRRPDVIHNGLVVKMRALNQNNTELRFVNELTDLLLLASLEFENQEKILANQQKQFEEYSIAFRNSARISKKSLDILRGKNLIIATVTKAFN